MEGASELAMEDRGKGDQHDLTRKFLPEKEGRVDLTHGGWYVQTDDRPRIKGQVKVYTWGKKND